MKDVHIYQTMFRPSFAIPIEPSKSRRRVKVKKGTPCAKCDSKNTVLRRDSHGKYEKCLDCKAIKSL